MEVHHNSDRSCLFGGSGGPPYAQSKQADATIRNIGTAFKQWCEDYGYSPIEKMILDRDSNSFDLTWAAVYDVYTKTSDSCPECIPWFELILVLLAFLLIVSIWGISLFVILRNGPLFIRAFTEFAKWRAIRIQQKASDTKDVLHDMIRLIQDKTDKP